MKKITIINNFYQLVINEYKIYKYVPTDRMSQVFGALTVRNDGNVFMENKFNRN